MWQQFVDSVKQWADKATVALQPRLAAAVRATVALVVGPIRAVLVAIVQTLAALLLLFLEWGWRPLERALAGLSRYFVFARLEAWIAGLPPYGALALFAAPAVCLVPVKLLALYLFATGHAALGISLIVGAKIAGTAIVARIFMLTQPKLMTIPWFRDAYERFMPWKERMFAAIRASSAWRTGRAVRVEVKRAINRTWLSLAPQRRWVGRQAAAARSVIGAFLDGLRRDLH